ncbi:head GIN domain-containing protein [Sphingosinithalassobacter portus]|uniref:head GIN domain-containing protein n=1 Tax=Stakelama portus TaxID=2676234 RepID=UPI000D6E0078|nr:head GIN domain-containing protein [Sphingosinithalassobacter portus]
MRPLILFAALPLAACGFAGNQGEHARSSGQHATRDFAASDFTQVDLRGSDDVSVVIGQQFKVHAEGDSKQIERLRIEVVDGTLRIGREGNSGWSWGSDDDVHIQVTMPRITGASVSGSGDMDVERGDGDFAGDISGSGNLNIRGLQAGRASLSISGSGDIEAAGNAESLTLSISGSGDIDAEGLTASQASVAVNGSGDVTATVNGNASVSVSGSGDVELGGGATCTVNKSGSGDVSCG